MAFLERGIRLRYQKCRSYYSRHKTSRAERSLRKRICPARRAHKDRRKRRKRTDPRICRRNRGARIVCRKLLWTEESRFSCCGKMYHYITFYYLADPVGGSDIPDTGSPFPQMDNSDVLLEWIPVSRLGNITIHPSFLKDEIGCTDGTLRHFVSIE